MTDPIILCDGLVKIFKIVDLEVVALQGLDLSVAMGEMLGVVGSSGSGKSTLLNILGGLDRPSAGRVSVDGQDLLKLSDNALNRYRRNKVGFVWQQTGRNLLPYLSAQENIELPMTVSGIGRREKREWAQELLQAVELYDRKDHRLTQLSGGQQQRVAISVALANKPTLLLADEPTGEVDSETAQLIFDTFRRLSELLDLTILIVTHDPRIVRQVDRVVAIRDGKTSTETIRRVSQLEQVMAGDGESPDSENGTDFTYHEYVVLDSAGRLQVPQAMRQLYGIGDRVELEPVDDGVLIRPISGRDSFSAAGESQTLDQQLAHLFSDERPVSRRGFLARLIMGRKR